MHKCIPFLHVIALEAQQEPRQERGLSGSERAHHRNDGDRGVPWNTSHDLLEAFLVEHERVRDVDTVANHANELQRPGTTL